MAFELNSSGPSRGRLSGIAVACILLHLALAPQIHLFGGAFNFMLVLTVSLAISLDSRTMVYIGFFSGLLYDLTTTGPHCCSPWWGTVWPLCRADWPPALAWRRCAS